MFSFFSEVGKRNLDVVAGLDDHLALRTGDFCAFRELSGVHTPSLRRCTSRNDAGMDTVIGMNVVER